MICNRDIKTRVRKELGIQNQRLLLEKYAANHGFGNTRFISDDGYTGTNFNRPGWQEVMELVESNQVSTIIVKDMSRLGREYLQVGQYTELIFPSYGIRFIAINDGVDSLYETTNDFTPFRNIINEFYAKDCSKKGRTSARVKAETGARIASRPCYGYMKDPDDPKRHIVPDEETAWVVKHIFALCAQGSGPAQIAKQLKREQIVNPSNHYYRKYGKAMTGLDTSRPYRWTSATVASILENETYLGHTINLRYTTISYKNKQRIMRPESEQLRFENTHEPLVDKQTWEIVQDIRKHKRRKAKFAEQNMLSGLVYCADCGSTMRLHRSHTMDAVNNNFMCSTYKKKGKDSCGITESNVT
ncbi:MAG: recombinase family protein [Clostridia bacterium]|nr:recombinase family protein [Clostridia bacterium]